MRWSESSENQWMIVKKKEQPSNSRGSVQTDLINLRSEPREISQSAKFCTRIASVHLGNRLAEQPCWDRAADHTDCQVEWEPRVCSRHEGKVKRSGIKGNSHCSFTSIKYWVLFQTSQVEKNGRNWKGSPSGLEPWEWCLKIMEWSWVCSVWRRGSSSRVT